MRWSAHILLLFFCTASIAQEPLPKSVFDQFADPSVTTIMMPQGKYSVTKNLPTIARSNVKINFGSGCTLVIDPANYATPNEIYPISVYSNSKNVIFATSPNGRVFRRVSHLSGEIKSNTTQLTMIEKTDLQPGEAVLIWAGVDKFDPVESYGYIPATVASVNTQGVITFTKPLGKDIPNFGSLDALKAATADALRYKVLPWGTWPDDSNFSRGYGVSHALERFDGGMVSNVTITGNPIFDIKLTPTASLPNACWLISAGAVNNFNVQGVTVNNLIGSALFYRKSFNVKASDITITGQGKSKIWNTKVQEAVVIGMWGGENLQFEKININAKDVSVIAVEVRAAKITLKDLAYKCEFTSVRDYAGSPQILGFYSMQDLPKIINASFDVTRTGGVNPAYQTYGPMLFDGQLKFAGPFLQWGFDWGWYRKHQFDGTVTIGGVEYGPQQMKTELIKVDYVQPTQTFNLPMNAGLYLNGRFRIKTKGDLVKVHDNMKTGNYDNALSGEWIPFDGAGFGAWYGLDAGAESLSTYKNAMFFFTFANTAGRRGSVVEFNYTYLPKK